MDLNDLNFGQPSIVDMSTDEAIELLRRIRLSRRSSSTASSRKKKKSSKLPKLTIEQCSILMKMLKEGGI